MMRWSVPVLALVLAVSANAEDWANSEGSCYSKGAMNVTVGGTLAYFGFFGAFDYGFHDCISGGIATGFMGHSNPYIGYDLGYYAVPVMVRAGFHPFNLAVLADKVTIRNKLDVFAGFAAGWHIGWTSWRGDGPELGEVDTWGGFAVRERIGARWYFTDSFYGTVEEGGGMGWFNLGVGFKF